MEAEKIRERVAEMDSELEDILLKKELLLKEKRSHFWFISLCNSSDSFRDFKEKYPDHHLIKHCKIVTPINSGWKSDVLFSVLKCDIKREEFLEFARMIVSPHVGEEDFINFEWKNKE